MVCEYCSAENCDSLTTCGTCGKPFIAPNCQQTLPQKESGQDVYRDSPPNRNGKAIFRTKSGFPLQADVVPTIPVQTASAVAPAISPATAPPPRRRTLSEISDLISPPQIEKETPKRPVLVQVPVIPRQKEEWAAKAHVGNSESSLLPFTRRKRMNRLMPITTPLQVGLVGSIITVSMAIALGSVWWSKTSSGGQAVIAGFFPSPVEPASSEQDANHFSKSGDSTIREYQASLAAASIQPDPMDLPPERAAQYTAELPDQISSRTEIVPKKNVTGSDTTSGKNVAARSPTAKVKKIPKTEPSSRTGRSGAPLARKERMEEIDRLKSQAFAETKRDRLDNARAAGKTSAPATPFNQQLAARTTPNKELLQCEQQTNFIQREQCKWRVCGGKWGRNGCPSYQRIETASY
jgi:hypothetical protein